jgi:hypothetical protein
MDSEEFTIPTSSDPFLRLLERIKLCTEVVQEIHYVLEPSEDAEAKADLLLAVEGLTFEVLDLMQTTKHYVWGDPLDDEEE